ncbi:unnamed protein product [Aphis gossypii]|uniref:Uncharacterized protein n=1 Tax=Aphis gossypii TaxID=80765 RepID=A0A9P0ILY5_APHGO|nr:unnamed protein product [Aphis gossypii]
MLSSTTDKVIGILGDRLEPLSNQYDCDSDYPRTGFRGENWANHTGGLCPMLFSPRCPTTHQSSSNCRPPMLHTD